MLSPVTGKTIFRTKHSLLWLTGPQQLVDASTDIGFFYSASLLWVLPKDLEMFSGINDFANY